MVVHQRINGWTLLTQYALELLVEQRLVVVDFKQGTPVYSWQGQGKDTDVLLQELSSNWLQQQQQQHQQQDNNTSEEKIDVESSSELNDSFVLSSQDSRLPLGSGLDLGDDASDHISSSFFDSNDVIHPPRSITSWSVRPSTPEERASYQEQERVRYSLPHKAFTFRQHGYESIVGPVKGIHNHV